MLITLKNIKRSWDVCEKVYGEKLTYVVGIHRNCLNEAVPLCKKIYVTEIKETYFEI